MSDVLLSFLLFLASSALIIAWLFPVYAVIRGLRHAWLYYETEYRFTHTEERNRIKFGHHWPHTVLCWLLSRFFAPWFGTLVAVSYVCDRCLGEHAATATDIAATRMLNLSSFLADLVVLLILGRYVYRAEKSNEYPDFSDHFQRRKILRGIAAVFAVLCVLSAAGLSEWLGGGILHKQARLYFVAGENLNRFRRLMPGHPDDWRKLPLNALQRVIFNRGARLVPDDDGEAAAWENRWFWSHYGRQVSPAFTPHTMTYLGRSPGACALLDKWWHCLEEMGVKPIRDPKARRELYLLNYHRLAWAAYENIYLQVPVRNFGRDSSDEGERIRRMTFEEQGAKLAPWLVRLTEEWQRTPENRSLIADHPHAEALGLLTLTLALKDVMRAEIRDDAFRCENDSVEQYLAARRQFFTPETGRPAWKRAAAFKGDSGINPTDSRSLHTYATQWQLFAQHVLEHHCGLRVPGRVAPRDCPRLRKDGAEVTPDQCLADRARSGVDKELRLMLDRLPVSAPK